MEWPKITKETPLEEIKRIHQAIWDYVIEHGKKPKTPYVANCIACEYDEFFRGSCLDCPIAWPGGYCSASNINYGGSHTQWLFESNPKKKAELARQIRDLPFKYELEEN